MELHLQDEVSDEKNLLAGDGRNCGCLVRLRTRKGR